MLTNNILINNILINNILINNIKKGIVPILKPINPIINPIINISPKILLLNNFKPEFFLLSSILQIYN